MHWLEQFDREKFVLLTLVITRISGLVIAAPFFNSQQAPAQVRALLVFAISLVILPTQWHVSMADPVTTINYLVLVGGELLIGLSLGLGVAVFLSGIQLGGMIIGQTGGLMLAGVIDPSTNEEVPTFSRLLHMTAIAVFVCIGGHRLLLAGLLDTFVAMPPGQASISVSASDALVHLLSESFRFGIRAALPIIAALLLSTLVMGLIARAVPQLNILLVGFGLNAMLTFVVLGLTIATAVMIFFDDIQYPIALMLQSLGIG